MTPKQISVFHDLLVALHDKAILDHLILIGSWAELIYEEIFPDFKTKARTMDVDFLYYPYQKNKVMNSIPNSIQSLGFYQKTDGLTGKTVFQSVDLEVEFLSKYDRTHSNTIRIPNLGIVAECIGTMDILERNIQTVHSKQFDCDIQVPTPEAYVMHKILINNEGSSFKQTSDASKIYNLYPYLVHDQQRIESMSRIYASFSKKQRKQFMQNAEDLNLDDILEIVQNTNQHADTFYKR